MSSTRDDWSSEVGIVSIEIRERPIHAPIGTSRTNSFSLVGGTGHGTEFHICSRRVVDMRTGSHNNGSP